MGIEARLVLSAFMMLALSRVWCCVGCVAQFKGMFGDYLWFERAALNGSIEY